MKKLALALAISSVTSAAFCQTWTKTTEIAANPLITLEKEFNVAGAPNATVTFEYSGGAACGGHTTQAPPWSSYFATLFINPITYQVTVTLPSSGYTTLITWEEDASGARGSKEGWTSSEGGGEKIREIVWYFLGFAQKPGDQ